MLAAVGEGGQGSAAASLLSMWLEGLSASATWSTVLGSLETWATELIGASFKDTVFVLCVLSLLLLLLVYSCFCC